MDTVTDDNSVPIWGQMLVNYGLHIRTLGQDIASRLDIPYLGEKESYSNASPSTFGNVEEAIQATPGGIVGVYAHFPTLTLVLVRPDGVHIGIRSTCLRLYGGYDRIREEVRKA